MNHEAYDEGWAAYLGFLELSAGKRVVSQEQVMARLEVPAHE